MTNAKMTIVYQVKGALYVNLTNRCPCACRFCLRQNAPGVYGSDSLWLEREPTVDEVIAALSKWDLATFPEVVFCGYGEPTERLDVLLEVGRWLKKTHPALSIRVNTNGLSDLISGRPTAADFAGIVDKISISLNSADPQEYLDICRPKFGKAAYPAMLKFAQEAAKFVPSVVMTIVGSPVTTPEQQSACQSLCDRLGLKLRIRPYETIQ